MGKKSKRKTNSAKPAIIQAKRIVLVGTYKGDQLTKWRGWYNYPISDDDKISAEDAAKITELWLFKGKKEQRNYKVSFVGIKTRQELISDYGYPANGKAHGDKYLLFKTDFKYQHKGDIPEDAERVIIRTADFATAPKVRKQLKAYLESPDRKDPDLAKRLPTILTKLRPEQLRVCEAAVQLKFLDILFPGKLLLKRLEPQWRTKRVIDLFAGCGGLSLGFEMAGFKPVLAIEKDAWAAETYSKNRSNGQVVTCDITQITDPSKSFSEIKDVFGIIGGPPCQGFSVSGGRDPKDPRNSLFMDYMRFVGSFHPAFFVMENVPGILSSVTKKGESVKTVIMAVARQIGYNVHQILLDAANFGVPQSRQRVFFIGIRDDYPFDPELLIPKPTTLSKPVTLWEAISDLPRIEACEGAETMSYTESPTNQYQAWCRTNSHDVKNHVAMRHTKRLVARFHVIQYGQSAADVPPEHMQRKRGDAGAISGKIYSQNNMKPFPDKPSPTVPASFQSNFVHPYIDRNFTAREGARLQSFPDHYIFYGRRTTMSWEKNLSQYQQIGNAVPPLLAKAVATMIDDYFSHISDIEDHSTEQE
ncbi:MAG: DNA (cytosine-5-)-methyltransferase [Kiritimatiellae bacterium]|nr:DNA (cytosine-5-)-methyltransferase [Kiritimatiellia bacterium]